MKFSYDHPLVYTIGETKPTLSVVKVKHGVTEISLSDGRLVRVSMHVDGVKEYDDKLDVNYQAVVEIMEEPSAQIMDVHESIQ